MPADLRTARRRFDEEQARFHRTVVEAVLVHGQRKTDVAADAGITRRTLDAWIRAANDENAAAQP